MLEESGLPYEAHRVDISGDQFDPEYVAVNPNSKIPSMIDPNGPDGQPIAVFESGAMLIYLAEKSGKLLSSDPRLRSETLQWLFFQIGGIGPFIGQFGHFYAFARDKTSDDYARTRYTNEAKRLLGVLDRRLDGREFLVGEDYSIADVATFPWIMAIDFYKGKDELDYGSLKNIEPWVQRCASRPATARGLEVTPFPTR